MLLKIDQSKKKQAGKIHLENEFGFDEKTLKFVAGNKQNQ